MSLRTTKLAVVACGLFVLSAVTTSAQLRLKGRVHAPGNNPFVAREQVAIEGAGQYQTDDHGEFEFDLVGDLKVGGEARFHVYHVNPAIKIQQWIVIRPCDTENGRTFSLPAVGSRPIPIVVLPKGDPRLKSLNKDSSILECTIEEGTSQFKPVSHSGGPNRSSLFDVGSPLIVHLGRYRPPNKSPVSRGAGFPRIAQAAYRVPAQEKPSVSSLGDLRDSTLLDQAFLTSKAKELGFTTEELVEALNVWARSVEDRYEKGLAALYERRYAEASEYISSSIPSPPGEFLKRYVPLARAEYEQGHYPAAEAALRKVLAVHSEDPLILNNLGVVLDAEAKYAEAEPLYKLALTIDEKTLGPDHPTVAICLNNLALLYSSQGRYAEAEPLYKRALTIDEKVLGPDHPDVAIRLSNLGLLYYSQGKYAEAEPLFKRALTIDEKVLGPDHPDVATVAENLAADLRTLGRDAEAKVYEDQAARIRAKNQN